MHHTEEHLNQVHEEAVAHLDMVHEHEIDTLKTHINQLESGNGEISDQAARHAGEVEALKAKFESEKNEHKHTKESLSSRRGETMSLRMQLAVMKRHMQDVMTGAGEASENWTLEHKALMDKVKTQEDLIAEREAEEKAALQAKVDELEKTHQHLSQKNIEVEETADKLKDANEKLKLQRRKSTAAAWKTVCAETKLHDVMDQSHGHLNEMQSYMSDSKEKAKSTQMELEQLRSKIDNDTQKHKDMEESVRNMEGMYRREMLLRKKYYNSLEDMKGKIRVYCRMRPISSSEKSEHGGETAVSIPDEHSIDVTAQSGMREKVFPFQFDEVFGPASTQEKVFEDTSHVVQSAFDGFNVSVFAYGQTGSGKTFTMIGTEDKPGLAPRCIDQLFEIRDSIKDRIDVEMEVYMVELHKKDLIDLLWEGVESEEEGMGDVRPELTIRRNTAGTVCIDNVTRRPVNRKDQLRAALEEGNQRRHVSATNMNAESSRSHMILGVCMTCTDRKTNLSTVGKLSLIDLAGSEKVAKTGATGDQLEEGMAINQGLTCLGDVIQKLSTGVSAGHIPYRNHQLTMLLSDSLGGNAKTLMFVNISPCTFNTAETINSLTYGEFGTHGLTYSLTNHAPSFLLLQPPHLQRVFQGHSVLLLIMRPMLLCITMQCVLAVSSMAAGTHTATPCHTPCRLCARHCSDRSVGLCAATRVKQIKNQHHKEVETAEIRKLKSFIEDLRAGKDVDWAVHEHGEHHKKKHGSSRKSITNPYG